MPQRRSAQKELRKSGKRRSRNLALKLNMKAAVKKIKKAAKENDPDIAKILSEAYKIIDTAASKKVIHPNKAARKKSRLSKLIKRSV